ncbi:hypothetical protein CL96_gp106 [Mycobacterium phage Firecracker]|uniref:Uncharacterized protein n=1 Tax=Mycobacterium phage Firecracker TaxID=2922998 RepID=G8I488_9CAUD|nr:hypothetical protein CL96_gp106 [Mycobacterium phage Firecracker]AER47532.1 hypothetical protein FIRECRACKER_106 [Mycobacterium phage Firecracker]
MKKKPESIKYAAKDSIGCTVTLHVNDDFNFAGLVVSDNDTETITAITLREENRPGLLAALRNARADTTADFVTRTNADYCFSDFLGNHLTLHHVFGGVAIAVSEPSGGPAVAFLSPDQLDELIAELEKITEGVA